LKKYLPYLFGVLILSGIILLYTTGKNKKDKKVNEQITLRRQDKIPYGTYVAYRNLHYLFPDAAIYTSRQEPGFWDSLSNYDAGQAYIVIADEFSADADEMRRLLKFAKNGNDVFISARTVSYEVADALKCSVIDISTPDFAEDEDGVVMAKDDSLRIRLKKPFFLSDSVFVYPGRKFTSSFTKMSTPVTNELGSGNTGVTNFIHLKTGKGNFYLHLAPLAFSNYFLLHKNNIQYYEMAMSAINPATTKIVWDEYYMNKGERKRGDGKEKGWMTVLFRYPALKAALLTAILTLLLYVLLEMRRKQRYIPVVSKPRNESMEFVKTIGRLYYDKADHKNLSRKMAAYFQEYVRTKYKMTTGNMDEDFIKTLQYKSGVQDYEIRGIVSFIKYLDDAPGINEIQVTEFYKQLEIFYQKA
jgi:hypothetical protein